MNTSVKYKLIIKNVFFVYLITTPINFIILVISSSLNNFQNLAKDSLAEISWINPLAFTILSWGVFSLLISYFPKHYKLVTEILGIILFLILIASSILQDKYSLWEILTLTINQAVLIGSLVMTSTRFNYFKKI